MPPLSYIQELVKQFYRSETFDGRVGFMIHALLYDLGYEDSGGEDRERNRLFLENPRVLEEFEILKHYLRNYMRYGMSSL